MDAQGATDVVHAGMNHDGLTRPYSMAMASKPYWWRSP